MSDAEWAITEPALPEPAWKQGRGGRPAQRCRRDTVDAIRYLVGEGIRWRAMPADFPHWRSVYDALDGWGKSGATEAMHDELRRACRIAAGRGPEPTAAVIDSQSVKAAETVAKDSRGFDAGKKVQGRKRHVAVDVIGLLLTVLVTAASVQDRDAARPLLWNLRKAFPTVRLAWADGIYAGKLVIWATTALKLTVVIVRRPDDLRTFQVLPRRWVVERTLAWITRHRRTVRDYERLTAHHEAIVYWAMIITMSRRLARQRQAPSRPACHAGRSAAGRLSRDWPCAPARPACWSGGVIVPDVGATVVSLGAWSELARADQHGMDIDVHEFAVLDDGRRLTLHHERGFSTGATHLTADQVKQDVLTTVLPDDAEVTGEDHPWEWLASLIRNHGVAATPEQLKTVPYVVEFGSRLAALLQSERQQER